MTMTPIEINWPGENIIYVFGLSKDALNEILTPIALQSWASALASPAFNPEPNLLMAILSAALAGVGIASIRGTSWSADTAERLYRGNPLLARQTVAQIVTAAAG